ncbi:hypothetical protein NC651_005117 [Populus alba x Populus x berolinensis]|nr:hypothetical protein NC651_005117 [Populus alba x Populus x berolinensis]
MDAEGQRGSSNPAAMLANLLSKRAKLHDELRIIEKQVYDLETSYLQDPGQCGNVLKGFEGFLSSSKNTALYGVDIVIFIYFLRFDSNTYNRSLKRSRKFQPEDRLFSLSSVTSPAEFPGMLNVYAKKKGKGKNGNQDKLKIVIYNEPNCLRDSSNFLGIALLKDMAEEQAAGRDEGRSEYGVGRSKGGGIYANGQGKPKKGRGASRDTKRTRPSADPDFDYDDDADLTLLVGIGSANLATVYSQLGSFIVSLLFAAGLRPTPAQATAVSWILKDEMQHVGKLICSNLGARMDSEPNHWRILADVLYDLGTGLEVLSPLCPHLFLEVAGPGNFAKGMAVVAARATRLPIYSSFAKEGNLSDLFAKGEAISTLFNVLGLGVGIQLASTVCSSMQGKVQISCWASSFYCTVCCDIEEMRATPVNTLNPQRTTMVVADFVKTGKISSPADLRYHEDLLFPGGFVEDAGNNYFPSAGNKWIDLVLDQNATGEDALKGWLVAAYALSTKKFSSLAKGSK